MKGFKQAVLKAAVSLLAISSIAPVVAQEGNNFYINPAIGVQNFSSARELRNEEFLSLGLEYRYGEHWASEINLMDSSPDLSGGNNDIDLTQYGIDGIYYFKGLIDPAIEKFEPYAVLGLGHAEFDGGSNTENETQTRLGLGVRYLLSDHWSLKADTRLVYGLDDDTRDSLVMLGVSYAFNKQGKAKPVAPVVVDSDGDGVSDANDRCPSTPAGVTVDANGCALDSDRDGVADYKDKCPNTPAGRQVDENGCKYVLKHTEEITLKVNFSSNSSVVKDSFLPEIEAVANFMKKYGAVTTVIEGYTDSTGAEDYNQALSQRRANAVMEILINRFNIAANRLTAVGYGEVRPVAVNDTNAGRLANRRVVAVSKAEVEK